MVGVAEMPADARRLVWCGALGLGCDGASRAGLGGGKEVASAGGVCRRGLWTVGMCQVGPNGGEGASAPRVTQLPRKPPFRLFTDFLRVDGGLRVGQVRTRCSSPRCLYGLRSESVAWCLTGIPAATGQAQDRGASPAAPRARLGMRGPHSDAGLESRGHARDGSATGKQVITRTTDSDKAAQACVDTRSASRGRPWRLHLTQAWTGPRCMTRDSDCSRLLRASRTRAVGRSPLSGNGQAPAIDAHCAAPAQWSNGGVEMTRMATR